MHLQRRSHLLRLTTSLECPRDSRSAAFIALSEGSETFYLRSNRDTLVQKRDTQTAVFTHLSYQGKKKFSPSLILSLSRNRKAENLTGSHPRATQIHRPSITNVGYEVRGGAGPGELVTGDQSPAWKKRSVTARSAGLDS